MKNDIRLLTNPDYAMKIIAINEEADYALEQTRWSSSTPKPKVESTMSFFSAIKVKNSIRILRGQAPTEEMSRLEALNILNDEIIKRYSYIYILSLLIILF